MGKNLNRKQCHRPPWKAHDWGQSQPCGFEMPPILQPKHREFDQTLICFNSPLPHSSGHHCSSDQRNLPAHFKCIVKIIEEKEDNSKKYGCNKTWAHWANEKADLTSGWPHQIQDLTIQYHGWQSFEEKNNCIQNCWWAPVTPLVSAHFRLPSMCTIVLPTWWNSPGYMSTYGSTIWPTFFTSSSISGRERRAGLP